MANLWKPSVNPFAALSIVPNPDEMLKEIPHLIMDNKEYRHVEVPVLPKLFLQSQLLIENVPPSH
jgi:hypothetical protein